MKKLILTSAAMIAFSATAVHAQMQGDDMSDGDMAQSSDMAGQQMPQMTAEQKAVYAGLTATQRTQFDSWDLTQKGLYFALSPEQRSQLWALPATQREAAWKQIRTAAGLPATAPKTGTSGSMNGNAMGSSTAANSGMMAGSGMATGTQRSATSGPRTPPPAAAANKDYPTCSRTVTDNCVNPGRK